MWLQAQEQQLFTLTPWVQSYWSNCTKAHQSPFAVILQRNLNIEKLRDLQCMPENVAPYEKFSTSTAQTQVICTDFGFWYPLYKKTISKLFLQTIMLFSSIKHGVLISLHLFHPCLQLHQKNKQHSNNPKRYKRTLSLKVCEGLVGGGRMIRKKRAVALNQ